MRQYNILLVDSEEISQRLIDLAFLRCRANFKLDAVDYLPAPSQLIEIPYDLLVVDPQAVGCNLSDLSKFWKTNPHLPVLIYSGEFDTNIIIEAFRLGVSDYVLKPCSANDLADSLMRCLAGRHEELSQKQPIDKMLMALMHDIRSPLISMSACVKLLNKGDSLRVADNSVDPLQILSSRCAKLIDIADEYLKMVDFASEKKVFQGAAVSLYNDVITPIMDELADEILENDILVEDLTNHFCLPDPPRVIACTVRLKMVFRNLLSNAIHHGGKGCRVGISFSKGTEYYQVNVFNDGPVIAHQDLQRLFRRIPLKERRQKGKRGAGVGLYLARELIREHGGDLWYETIDNSPNFIFSVPGLLPPQLTM